MFNPQFYSASALLLVYHGSRDPRPKIFCHQLANYLQQIINLSESQGNYLGFRENSQYDVNNSKVIYSTPAPSQPELGSSLVETVALELAELPLHQNIVQVAQKAIALGKKNLLIIPLFLSLGIHVTQDIPSEIALAQRELQQSITIISIPPLGSYIGLEKLLLAQFKQFAPSDRILLAHGSRLPRANLQTESLARYCNAQVAYWSTEPDLESILRQKLANIPEKMAIMPYFLFPGRITDAIADKVAQLQLKFPKTSLILGQPLGATATLAQLIFDNLRREIRGLTLNKSQ